MARPQKKGLDYFPLDCTDDEKLFKIKLTYGLHGWGLIIKLYSEVYNQNGYYANNNQDTYNQLMFNCNIDTQSKTKKENVKEIVQFAIDIGIFDKNMAEEKRILTSKKIQENYIMGAFKRFSFKIEKKYSLLTKEDVENYNPRLVIVGKNILSGYSYDKQSGDESGNKDTKEKRLDKIKEDKIKEDKIKELKELRKQDKEKNIKKKKSSIIDLDDKEEETKRNIREIAKIDWTR